MKKSLFLVSLLLFMATGGVFAQQDTITGFNFADSTDTEFNADFGLTGNLTYDIRAEDTAGNQLTLYYTNGASNFAATATGWDAGANIKYWSIKFKADGYMSFKISSKQSAGGSNPGPKYWKLQCKLSGGNWEDISADTIVVANNWTSGVVTDWDLPATMDNPGTTSVYIRWLMVSNVSSAGPDVLTTGIAKIDDILVTGVNSVGVESVIYQDQLNVYPNPVQDVLNFESTEEISRVEIYDMQGAQVVSSNERSLNTQVNVADLVPGLYFVRVYFANQTECAGRKIIVQ